MTFTFTASYLIAAPREQRTSQASELACAAWPLVVQGPSSSRLLSLAHKQPQAV